MDRAAKGATGKAPKPVPGTAPGGTDAEGGKAPETEARQEAQPVGLPALSNEAAAAPVPAVRAVASNDYATSPVASFLRTIRAEVASAASALAGSFFAASADADAEGRRLLGLGVLALTLLGAALIAWKLPLRRTTREEAERWGHRPDTPATMARRRRRLAPLPSTTVRVPSEAHLETGTSRVHGEKRHER
jgi:hypothetical protein